MRTPRTGENVTFYAREIFNRRGTYTGFFGSGEKRKAYPKTLRQAVTREVKRLESNGYTSRFIKKEEPATQQPISPSTKPTSKIIQESTSMTASEEVRLKQLDDGKPIIIDKGEKLSPAFIQGLNQRLAGKRVHFSQTSSSCNEVLTFQKLTPSVITTEEDTVMLWIFEDAITLTLAKESKPISLSPSAENGREIRSLNGRVTGGNIVEGRYYDVFLEGTKIVDSTKLGNIDRHTISTYYLFGDEWLNDNRKEFVFIEVQAPSKPEVMLNKEIEFVSDDTQISTKFNQLVHGQMYNVRQSQTGRNFSGIFNGRDSSCDDDDGFAYLNFGVDQVCTFNGKIIVSAVEQI